MEKQGDSLVAAVNVEINNLQFLGFGNDAAIFDLVPPISRYVGHPLYCHVVPIGGSAVGITVNQNAPNSFNVPKGELQMVTVAYDNQADKAQSATRFIGGGLTYSGQPLEFFLTFDLGMSKATLVFDQRKPNVVAGTTDTPTIGIVVLTPKVTGAAAIGHFVNVPLDGVVRPAHKNFPSATITFPDSGPGSVSGPIGGVTVP